MQIGGGVVGGVGGIKANEDLIQRKRDLEATRDEKVRPGLTALRNTFEEGYAPNGLLRSIMGDDAKLKAFMDANEARFGAAARGSATSAAAQEMQHRADLGLVREYLGADIATGQKADTELGKMYLSELGYSDILTKPLPENKLAVYGAGINQFGQAVSASRWGDSPSEVDSDGKPIKKEG